MPESEPETPEVELLNPNKPPRIRVNGEIDRRAFSSRKNGSSPGCGGPVQQIRDTEAAIDAAVEHIETGACAVTLAKHHALTVSEAEKVVSLTGLAPDEFFGRIASRMENILERMTSKLEANADNIKDRDLMLQIAIGTDKLLALRGQKAPTSVHQTNITINGVGREAALAMLTGKKPEVKVAPVA